MIGEELERAEEKGTLRGVRRMKKGRERLVMLEVLVVGFFWGSAQGTSNSWGSAVGACRGGDPQL